MEFIKDYPIKQLIPADYNPRVISSSSFERLIESIKTFGIVKPVIINGANGILTAGHQRTKAIKQAGLKNVPVIRLKNIVKSDEIMFNLFHNSIETSKSKVFISDTSTLEEGYHFINPKQITFQENKNATIVKEIGKLIIKYGPWGSVICDSKGLIFENSDYAIACKLLNQPVLVYKVDNAKAKILAEYLSIDYGEYNFNTLGIKDYNQTFCQMNRLVGEKPKRSTTYANFVIPFMRKDHRILDFGAGKGAYYQKLKEQGFDIFMYEPFYKGNGSFSFKIDTILAKINEIQEDIDKRGLFDVVVLDSVINSITSDEMQHNVLLTCNSLMNDDAVFFTGTRSLGQVEHYRKAKQTRTKKRTIEFLDKDNFSVTFRNGVWTKQKFHTKKSLYDLLKLYFDDVVIHGANLNSNIYGVCRKPKRWALSEYEKALNVEFNMVYPKGFKHNKHEKIVRSILTQHEHLD